MARGGVPIAPAHIECGYSQDADSVARGSMPIAAARIECGYSRDADSVARVC